MITFLDSSGNVIGVAQDLNEFHHYFKQGAYFIEKGIIYSPSDHPAVARAIVKLLKAATIKSYAMEGVR